MNVPWIVPPRPTPPAPPARPDSAGKAEAPAQAPVNGDADALPFNFEPGRVARRHRLILAAW
ncbi:hypothetical protein ACLESD_26630, partial [Pyxidicoccus sp. 3LFB2]